MLVRVSVDWSKWVSFASEGLLVSESIKNASSLSVIHKMDLNNCKQGSASPCHLNLDDRKV